MILPPGGFFAFGILVALAQRLNEKLDKRDKPETDVCAGAVNDRTACLLCGGCSFGRDDNQPVDPDTARFTRKGGSQ